MTKHFKCYKGQEDVVGHDCLHPDGSRHIKEEKITDGANVAWFFSRKRPIKKYEIEEFPGKIYRIISAVMEKHLVGSLSRSV